MKITHGAIRPEPDKIWYSNLATTRDNNPSNRPGWGNAVNLTKWLSHDHPESTIQVYLNLKALAHAQGYSIKRIRPRIQSDLLHSESHIVNRRSKLTNLLRRPSGFQPHSNLSGCLCVAYSVTQLFLLIWIQRLIHKNLPPR